MKRFIVLALAAAVIGIPAMVFAEQIEQSAAHLQSASESQVASGPVQMTDAEMDQVTAGALLTVTVAGNDILNNNKVGVNAAANAAIGVLGNAAACCAAARLTQ